MGLAPSSLGRYWKACSGNPTTVRVGFGVPVYFYLNDSWLRQVMQCTAKRCKEKINFSEWPSAQKLIRWIRNPTFGQLFYCNNCSMIIAEVVPTIIKLTIIKIYMDIIIVHKQSNSVKR